MFATIYKKIRADRATGMFLNFWGLYFAFYYVRLWVLISSVVYI